MNKVKIGDSLVDILAAANAAYDKNIKKEPLIFKEESRIHFVQGWLMQAYENLYKRINS